MNLRKQIKKLVPKQILNLRHLFYAWYGAVKYHNPSKELFVIGITGTSGKSTTVYLLRQLLENCGLKVGSLSTIDFYINGENKLNDKKMTMLGKMAIQKYLREMVDKGCDIAIVETTSEGRVQHRNKFINYDTIVLTNLYPEHIDSHGSFEKYKQAKLDIFEYVAMKKSKKQIANNKKSAFALGFGETRKTAVVNGDSQFAGEFLNYDFEKKYTFKISNKFQYSNSKLENIDDEFIATNTEVNKSGLFFEVQGNKFHAQMFGEHNIGNIMAAISVARSLNIDWQTIQKAVENFKNVPGRIEFIKEAENKGFQVIVDYAFEPVALQGLYNVVDLLKPKRVIHVCGSTGGGRDKARRKPIGKLVGEKSDIFIVTDEDPYDEDPSLIMDEVVSGALESGKKMNENLFKIINRREAIKKAIELALPGDLILITGKGSEQAMCVAGGKMVKWDDREIVKNILKEK